MFNIRELAELIYEVVEDIPLARAVEEGKDSENVERDESITFQGK
jgi:hypothetical protein